MNSKCFICGKPISKSSIKFVYSVDERGNIVEHEIHNECVDNRFLTKNDAERRSKIIKELIKEGIEKLRKCPVNIISMAKLSINTRTYCRKCSALEHVYQFLGFQSSFIEGGCHGSERFKVIYKKGVYIADLTPEALEIFTYSD